MPSVAVATQAFATLGNRPKEMLKALGHLSRHLPPGANPDEHLPVISATLRSTAADIELTKVEQLGGLASAIFERVAASDGDVRGVFSSEAAAEYTKAIGREVRIEEIQPVVNDLLASNLIMRRGHGMYGVTDPFVQQIWREKKAAPWAPGLSLVGEWAPRQRIHQCFERCCASKILALGATLEKRLHPLRCAVVHADTEALALNVQGQVLAHHGQANQADVALLRVQGVASL